MRVLKGMQMVHNILSEKEVVSIKKYRLEGLLIFNGCAAAEKSWGLSKWLMLRGGIDWLRSMLATRLAYRVIEDMVIY